MPSFPPIPSWIRQWTHPRSGRSRSCCWSGSEVIEVPLNSTPGHTTQWAQYFYPIFPPAKPVRSRWKLCFSSLPWTISPWATRIYLRCVLSLPVAATNQDGRLGFSTSPGPPGPNRQKRCLRIGLRVRRLNQMYFPLSGKTFHIAWSQPFVADPHAAPSHAATLTSQESTNRSESPAFC